MQIVVISETKQEFNGKAYWLCGQYFQRKGQRLHRLVWSAHNGEIPKGFAVHHIDGDRSNNQIENLKLMPESKHLSHHGKTGDRRKWAKAMRDGAKKWHGSEAGIEWHKKQYQKHCKPKINQSVDKKCLNCGKEFAGKKISKYCSNNCKSAYRRKQGKDLEKRFCEACGKEFMVNKYWETKTCSPKCGSKVRKDRTSR